MVGLTIHENLTTNVRKQQTTQFPPLKNNPLYGMWLDVHNPVLVLSYTAHGLNSKYLNESALQGLLQMCVLYFGQRKRASGNSIT